MIALAFPSSRRNHISDLNGKRALVTGADQSESAGDRSITGDLTQPNFCDGLAAVAAERMGGLDTLVNNAGIITRGKITETTDDDYFRTIAINVEAPFRTCRAAIPLMADSGAARPALGRVWFSRPARSLHMNPLATAHRAP